MLSSPKAAPRGVRAAVLAEAPVAARGEDQFRTETEDEAKSAVEGPRDAGTLQLLAEELSVAKETRETGRVRISTHTHEREAPAFDRRFGRAELYQHRRRPQGPRA